MSGRDNEAAPSAFQSPVKVLVDNCIYRFLRDADLRVMPPAAPSDRNGFVIRQPRDSKDWRMHERPALRGLGDMARRREIVFCTTGELFEELFNSSEPFQTWSDEDDLWAGVSIEDLPSPVIRSRYMQMPSHQYALKSERVAFFQMLRRIAESGAGEAWVKSAVRDVSPFEIDSARNLRRFAELCRGMGDLDTKVLDAYHLWCAERSGVSFFLTLDKTFINFMAKTSRAESTCRPVLPSTLVATLRPEATGPDMPCDEVIPENDSEC